MHTKLSEIQCHITYSKCRNNISKKYDKIKKEVHTNGTKTWLDRDNNIKILFSTTPAQPTIATPSVLRFTVQNLQTGKPVTNLLARVVIFGGTSNQEVGPCWSFLYQCHLSPCSIIPSYYKDNVTNSRCFFLSIVYSYRASPAICFESFWRKLHRLD